MTNRRFVDLPWPARVVIIVVGALEVGLLAAAQIDITRRPAAQIRGGKLRWRLVSLINIIGPIVYFRRGRIDPTGPGAAPAGG